MIRSFSQRIYFMMLIDALLVNGAVFAALLFRFDGHIPGEYLVNFIKLTPLLAAVNLGCLYIFKLYGRVWKYASWGELTSIFLSASSSMILTVIIIEAFSLPRLPRTVYILGWIFITLAIGISRLWWRLLKNLLPKKYHSGTKVLIVGAGDAGAMLVHEIQSNPHLGLEAVAFVDDDPKKMGKMMLGLPIKGSRYDIPEMVADLGIEEIIIAIPSIKGRPIRGIVNICEETPAKLRILPHLYQSSQGSIISQVRRVKMEDLLSRHPVEIDLQQVCGYVQGRTVLVTGGGGSIGSELCRQIVKFLPRQLIIIDSSENDLFDIEMELKNSGWGQKLDTELLDIKNRDRLEAVFQKYRPQLVYHAAAYKHVPMMERHPEAALANNVLGTHNVAEMADKYRAETFILISTDKAVNPTSVMGASKRFAELVIQDINRNSTTNFAAVRFGNVLGSRGSVIPTFEKQIEKGGPVTVTHPEMTRYFMTIPEAVELVIQAGAMAKGGEVFVLDMGEPVKIADIARDLIRLYGFEPGQDIEIVYTGIRPGEKLYEELFSSREEMAATKHERIFISKKEMDSNYTGINKNIEEWVREKNSNRDEIVKLFAELIPEYQGPQGYDPTNTKVIPIKAVR